MFTIGVNWKCQIVGFCQICCILFTFYNIELLPDGKVYQYGILIIQNLLVMQNYMN